MKKEKIKVGDFVEWKNMDNGQIYFAEIYDINQNILRKEGLLRKNKKGEFVHNSKEYISNELKLEKIDDNFEDDLFAKYENVKDNMSPKEREKMMKLIQECIEIKEHMNLLADLGEYVVASDDNVIQKENPLATSLIIESIGKKVGDIIKLFTDGKSYKFVITRISNTFEKI